MITYHGSDIIVNKPDILHSVKRLDFGCGFYYDQITFVTQKAIDSMLVYTGYSEVSI